LWGRNCVALKNKGGTLKGGPGVGLRRQLGGKRKMDEKGES